MTSTHPVVYLSEERARVASMPEDTFERTLAELRLAEVKYAFDRAQAAATISAACSQIEAKLNGVANPNRPYLSWNCCGVHRSLAERRDELVGRAEMLGVESHANLQRVVAN